MVRSQTNIDLEMAKHGYRTDSELAAAMGFSQQQLSYRINGKISMDTLERLAAFFNTTVKKLLKD